MTATATSSTLGTLVAGNRLTMLLTPTRVAYLGLLGVPGTRVFGAVTVYLPVDAPKLSISLQDGAWLETDMAVIPPYESHHIRSDGRLVICLLIEAETVDVEAAIRFVRSSAGIVGPRIRAAVSYLQKLGPHSTDCEIAFDSMFFGNTLPPRRLDSRIAKIVDRVRIDPAAHVSASECADACRLSESRFIHLFKSQTETTFRRFRAWKRARSFLAYANGSVSATEVALDVGYPDSTHFSHSIRRFYGYKPKDIFVGSRRLVIISLPPEESMENTSRH